MNIIDTGGAGFIGSRFLNRPVPRDPEHPFILAHLIEVEGR